MKTTADPNLAPTNVKSSCHRNGLLRLTLVALAACLSLGVSSCVTTAPKAAIAAPAGGDEVTAAAAAIPRYAASRDHDSEGVPKKVADTTLRAVSVPLGAAGWVIGHAALPIIAILGAGWGY